MNIQRWKQRNKVVFEEEKQNIQIWKMNMMTNLWGWAKLESGNEVGTFVHFIDWFGK